MSFAIRLAIAELVERGGIDWVADADVAEVVKGVFGPKPAPDHRDLQIRLVSEVIARSLMEVGDLSAGYFTPWDLSETSVSSILEQRWGYGVFECWLSNTAKGARIGDRLVEFWNSPIAPKDKLLAMTSYYGAVDASRIDWLVDKFGADSDESTLTRIRNLVDSLLGEGLAKVGHMVNGEFRQLAPARNWSDELLVTTPYVKFGEWWIRSTPRGAEMGRRLLSELGFRDLADSEVSI